MMSLPFGLFTQVSGSGPLGPLVCLKLSPNGSHNIIALYPNNSFIMNILIMSSLIMQICFIVFFSVEMVL